MQKHKFMKMFLQQWLL